VPAHRPIGGRVSFRSSSHFSFLTPRPTLPVWNAGRQIDRRSCSPVDKLLRSCSPSRRN
jgi:hypothetical protein